MGREHKPQYCWLYSYRTPLEEDYSSVYSKEILIRLFEVRPKKLFSLGLNGIPDIDIDPLLYATFIKVTFKNPPKLIYFLENCFPWFMFHIKMV